MIVRRCNVNGVLDHCSSVRHCVLTSECGFGRVLQIDHMQSRAACVRPDRVPIKGRENKHTMSTHKRPPRTRRPVLSRLPCHVTYPTGHRVYSPTVRVVWCMPSAQEAGFSIDDEVVRRPVLRVVEVRRNRHRRCNTAATCAYTSVACCGGGWVRLRGSACLRSPRLMLLRRVRSKT